jgi:hypothetical protein
MGVKKQKNANHRGHRELRESKRLFLCALCGERKILLVCGYSASGEICLIQFSFFTKVPK